MSQTTPETIIECEPFFAESEHIMTEQAQRVREFVKSQVGVWQELPMLALQADGKHGYSNELQNIYRYGLVRVGSGKHFADNPEQRPMALYGVYVDCATGNLLRLTGNFRNPNDPGYLAEDAEVFHLWATKTALGKLGELIAAEHRSFLLADINMPRPNYYSEADEARRQHNIADAIVRLNLTRHFVRPQEA